MSGIHNSHAARWRFRRPRGIALVVILILLMAITTVVAFSARHAVVGESSARNQMDYEVARQAAEAALRDGERDVLREEGKGKNLCARDDDKLKRFGSIYFKSDCPKGQCSESKGPYTWAKNSAAAEHWWPDQYGGKWGKNISDESLASSDFYGGVPFGTCTGAEIKVIGVEHQPEYLLEYLPRDRSVVRVTARGFGVAGYETQVVLQSYVMLPLMFP